MTAPGLSVWLESMPVKDWMRGDVLTVRSDTPVSDAARMMRERKIRHLPVLDARGRLAGVVTDRDLRQVIFDPAIQERLGSSIDTLRSLTVREVMTWGAITVSPETDLRQAARLMHEQKIGSLPVVRDSTVVGLLTESDVLAALRDLLRKRVTGARPLRGAPASEPYDYGLPVREWEDLWQNSGPDD